MKIFYNLGTRYLFLVKGLNIIKWAFSVLIRFTVFHISGTCCFPLFFYELTFAINFCKVFGVKRVALHRMGPAFGNRNLQDVEMMMTINDDLII